MGAIVASIQANAARNRVIIIVMFKFQLPAVTSRLRSKFPGAPPTSPAPRSPIHRPVTFFKQGEVSSRTAPTTGRT